MCPLLPVGHVIAQDAVRAIAYRLCYEDPDFSGVVTRALVLWMGTAEDTQLGPAWTIVRGASS
jgi:hypothetical protein